MPKLIAFHSLRYIILLFLGTGLSTTLSSQQLVLPGDHPDPSVVKIGDTYWSSATTSNWMPAFPLMKSRDLVNWTTTSHVFYSLPEWADYYFWAPEITYDNGKVYLYYAAHKKNGNLCVGVASADKPEGPYRDHGPLICQEAGSIDAFPIRDSNGKLYLVWKEDGNSVRKPTPIWAMEMNEDRTALLGEKKELFRNDQPWEGNLVEGVSMIRHGEYYYAFYAAAGCCGIGCNYVSGVARSRNLLGPWEKYQKNPILTNSEEWKCPGHGTPVEKDGKYYFLYHAYNNQSNVHTGREGLLIEFQFTPDGWIQIVKDNHPGVKVKNEIKDNFKGKTLSSNWQWSVFQTPVYKLKKNSLELSASSSASGAYIGQKTFTSDYHVDVQVVNKKSAAGVAAIGDDKNMVMLLVKDDSLNVVQLNNDKLSIIASKAAPHKARLHLRMEVINGQKYRFLYSTNGRSYLAVNTTAVNGEYLPPWDRAVRVGLVSKGQSGEKATFKKFSISNTRTK